MSTATTYAQIFFSSTGETNSEQLKKLTKSLIHKCPEQWIVVFRHSRFRLINTQGIYKEQTEEISSDIASNEFELRLMEIVDF